METGRDYIHDILTIPEKLTSKVMEIAISLLLIRGFFIKIHCYFLLLFISTFCFSQSIEFNPESKDSANDIYNMADMYHAGNSVVPKDLDAAFQLYEKAAELGSTDAQCDFGDYYYAGVKVKQSYQKANYWYTKAANKNNAKAQLYLGYAYLTGKGFTIDYVKSRHWFELAVKQNQPSAKYHLGTMYLDGKGVTKNEIKANSLFQESYSGGEPMACEKLKKMGITK